MNDYARFLLRKSQLAGMAGFAPLWLPDCLKPFQRLLTDWAIRKGRAALFEGCGLGKALASDTHVLTPTGYQNIGSLIVGDQVIGANGEPTEVLGVYPQGQREAYRITFSDHSQVVCDVQHLWTVRRARSKCWRTLTLADILKGGLGGPGDGKVGRHARWFIPMTAPVRFKERQNLPLHPYVLGCLLGDGYMVSHTPEITSADSELIDRLNGFLPLGMRAVKKRYSKYDYTIIRTDPPVGGSCMGKENPLMEALRELGLWGTDSYTKFVPDCYKFSDLDTRTWLLQGLLDTNGGVWIPRRKGQSPTVEYTSVSRQLCSDVAFLVHSIGGRACIRERQTVCNRRRGVAYRITPNFPHGFKPFLLSRKAALWKDREKYEPSRSIRSVEPCGICDMTCIKVAAPDGLFLVNECLVTHNTLQTLVWCQNVVQYTNRPVLVMAPLAVSGQIAREGEKFGIACKVSRDGTVHKPITITNYQRLHYFDPDDFSGAAADESQSIKAFEGKLRKQVTRFLSKMRFRLLATATPSPNDFIELGTASEALGELTQSEMLAQFFRSSDKKRHSLFKEGDFWNRQKYFFKPHSEVPFWRWVCSWARACRSPADLGFDDPDYNLPPLTISQHVVPSTYRYPGELFPRIARTLAEQRVERKHTLQTRCEKVAELVSHDRPAVIWCQYNPEGDLLEKLIPGAVQVAGKDDDDVKEERLLAFTLGQIKKLVTKPRIASLGLNWQHCGHQTYFPSHSAEQWHQGISRSCRFGRTDPVQVDVVASQGEEGVTGNLTKKLRQMDEMFTNLVRFMNDQQGIAYAEKHVSKLEVPSWL